ncbi:MAG: 3-phosphoshikimate 1-carboxyvinyltransferase [Balneolaceae bacterium]
MDEQIFGAKRLRGELTLPPDKSISHRAALFAAIAEGVSTIGNYSKAADPQSTLSCLRQLGVTVDQNGSVVRIEGVGRDGLRPPSNDLDCGNSGTTMRLLSGILAGAGVSSRLRGDASLTRRTMKRIIDPLAKMGAEIEGREGKFAPLRIGKGRGIRGMRYPLPIASAQLKSAVLLAGLYGEEETEVVETVPSRDHTERLLQLPVDQEGSLRVIRSSRSVPVPLQSYHVPGDFSAAAFWLVAGAVHPDAEIVLDGVGLNPTRTGALQILQEMGADIEVEEQGNAGSEPVGRITVRSSHLRAIRLDPALIPNSIDELPVLMVAMCFATGKSEITQAEELRHKETDRLHAMARLLEAAGESFEIHQDGISINGSGVHKVRSASYESEHDHRIAMAAAVISLMAEGRSVVQNAEATAISYPEFWNDLRQLSGSV